MLLHEDLTEYKQLYEQEFGVVLSDQEAREGARRLLRMYRAVFFESNSSLQGRLSVSPSEK